MSNGGRADGPLVLWPEWAVDRRQRERDGGFKYFDNDHIHADDHVDDDEDYFRDGDHLDTEDVCQIIYMLAVFKNTAFTKNALCPQNDKSEE